MSKARKTLALLPHEEKVLRDLYIQANIPSDQFPQRQEEFEQLVQSWNLICGRDEEAPEVLHYIVTKRKKGEWVKLGRKNCKKLQNVSLGLCEDELSVLDAIHEEMQVASDRFALDSELAERLKDEFAKRTGRIFPPLMLAAAMIRRRKIGALATLKPSKSVEPTPFADMDKVASM